MTPAERARAILTPAVRDAPDYNAGVSLERIRAETGLDRIVKLDSNECALPPSDAAVAALAALGPELARYPDREELRLRALIAEELGIEPARLAFAAGSEDLIALLFRVVLRPGDRVLTAAPSFGMYEIAAAQAGAETLKLPFRDDWSFPVPTLVSALAAGPRILVLSSPCNPTGGELEAEGLDRLLRAAGEETLVVLDEAYADFLPPGRRDAALARLAGHDGPWMLLRTFSKAHALAGLRLGWGVTFHPLLAEAVYKRRSPFNVSAAALAAAEASWSDRDRLARVREAIETERERMAQGLQALGFAPAPSSGNFLFFDCGGPADLLAARLRRRGVLVKPWREAGWESHVRVSVGTAEETDAVLEALAHDDRSREPLPA